MSGEAGGGSVWPESAPRALTCRCVRFRPPEKRRAWPARGWDSSSGALRKVEDLLLAHLMVWSMSEKDFARESRQKMSPEKLSAVRVF